MFIGKENDGTVAIGTATDGSDIKKAYSEWAEVDSLPDEQEFLLWNDLDPAQPTVSQEAKMSYVVNKFTIVTDNFIYDVLNDYNVEHGIKLESVHNCESYSRKTGYTHQPFCQAIWDWSVDLWEAVRGITTIPTDEEFKAVVRSVTNVELQARLDKIELRF
jgi:hypothetical protein